LGGVQGVVQNAFYISGYEALGHKVANTQPIREVIDFLLQQQTEMNTCSDAEYFFFEAIADAFAANKIDNHAVIAASPACFKKYLEKYTYPEHQARGK